MSHNIKMGEISIFNICLALKQQLRHPGFHKFNGNPYPIEIVAGKSTKGITYTIKFEDYLMAQDVTVITQDEKINLSLTMGEEVLELLIYTLVQYGYKGSYKDQSTKDSFHSNS